nr:hypothetical protein [Haloferax sp. BAB-2207]
MTEPFPDDPSDIKVGDEFSKVVLGPDGEPVETVVRITGVDRANGLTISYTYGGQR